MSFLQGIEIMKLKIITGIRTKQAKFYEHLKWAFELSMHFYIYAHIDLEREIFLSTFFIWWELNVHFLGHVTTDWQSQYSVQELL